MKRSNFRSTMLDILTVCTIISSVALFTVAVFTGDKEWIIVACGIGGLAVWLTESDAAL